MGALKVFSYFIPIGLLGPLGLLGRVYWIVCRHMTTKRAIRLTEIGSAGCLGGVKLDTRPAE